MDSRLPFLAFLLLIAALVALPTRAHAASIESYGMLPAARNLAISPSGSRIAWIQELADVTVMVIIDVDTGERLGALRLSEELKARNLTFATEDQVILRISDARRLPYARAKMEFGSAFSYSIEQDKVRLLLRRTEGIYPYQSGLGKIVGITPDGYALMPAYSDNSHVPYDLYKVKLSSGKGRVYRRGNSNTDAWYANAEGEIIAREDFDAEKQKHSFHAYDGFKSTLIYEYETALQYLSPIGVRGNHLVIADNRQATEIIRLLDLSTGEFAETLYANETKEVDHYFTDINGAYSGVQYTGLLPSFDFLDGSIQALFENTIVPSFPASSVDFIDANKDFSRIIISVSGNAAPPSYLFYDKNTNKFQRLVSAYPNLGREDIAEIIGFNYHARDDLKIPAVLTWPLNSSKEHGRTNLPLIVMPHGGPASYDRVEYAWDAQYFASLGYAVLQPNFRGSTGFGAQLQLKGRKQWGLKMQDDLTDGVQYLIDKGIVDAERVCILGHSYGGYAAMAGAVFSPDLYRCAVAINGISDIAAHANWNYYRYADDDYFRNYYNSQFGEGKEYKELVKKTSPVNFADQAQAPILLIYSKDDTVVNPKQSKAMHKALKKAKKESTLVALDGEDHWFSTTAMRLEGLKLMSDFLLEHNPPN